LKALKDVTPHDLRRTARTHLTGDRMSVDEITAEHILGHLVGSRQQNTYDLDTYITPKRVALEAWASELRYSLQRPPGMTFLAIANGAHEAHKG
jgi:integrase